MYIKPVTIFYAIFILKLKKLKAYWNIQPLVYEHQWYPKFLDFFHLFIFLKKWINQNLKLLKFTGKMIHNVDFMHFPFPQKIIALPEMYHLQAKGRWGWMHICEN